MKKRDCIRQRKIISGCLFVALCAIVCMTPVPIKADVCMSSEGSTEGAPEAQKPATGTIAGHDWVDLGLSVKWATCNVGASSPEEYGKYYAWGETTTKTEYTEENCKTYGRDFSDISGNSQYDAARANWGGSWRLPTEDEMRELVKKCTWTWTTRGGYNGYKVTGPNGNSIFLPAAGFRHGSSLYGKVEYGTYWCSTPYDESEEQIAELFTMALFGYSTSSDTQSACRLHFSNDYPHVGSDFRYSGYSIRPVIGGSAHAEVKPTTGMIAGHDWVDLGLSVKWATCNVGASSPEEYGKYYAWGETTTKTEYTEGNSKTYYKELGDIAGNPQYDVARANWSGSWRLPTEDEMRELVDKCDWTWTTQDGHYGYKVTSKTNGNFIFLPAAGWRKGLVFYDASEGYYCCSTPYPYNDVQVMYYLYFHSGLHSMNCGIRFYGYSVRPVSE